MGNTNASPSVEQEFKAVLNSEQEVSDEMLASLMWDSPPEDLLSALKEDDFGLSEFVWLDKKEEGSNNGHDRSQLPDDEARAKRLAEIRKRVEQEVARRRAEMAQQEEAAEKRKQLELKSEAGLVPLCAHCKAPVTKGNTLQGKVYCKAHNAQLLKARALEQKAKHHRPHNSKKSH